MKSHRLIFCCLMILLAGLSRSAIAAQPQDEPIEGLLTVQSRREALAQAIAEREPLRTAGDPASLARVSNKIVQLNLKLCDLDAAQAAASESLTAARQLAATNQQLLIDTLILAGYTHSRRTENQTALQRLEEALTLSRQLQDKDREALSLAQIAAAYFELGNHEEAKAKNDLALELFAQHANKRGEAQARTTQSIIYMNLDRIADSSAELENAEALWRSLGDDDELANTLIDQAFFYIRQGQWHSALVLLNEVQPLVPEKEAEPYVAGKVATTFGEIYEAYGELQTSLSYFREALHWYQDFAHDKRAAIDAGNQIGRVLARQGNFAEAQQQANENLQAAVGIQNDQDIGLCHEVLGIVSFEAGSYEAARSEFATAITSLTRSNSQRLLARVQTYLGQTEYLLGNLPQAATAYEKGLRIFSEVQDYTNEAALRLGLGKLALKQGKLEQAEEHLRRSIQLTEQLRLNAYSRDLRSSFLASVHDRYRTQVECLMLRSFRENNKQLAIQAFETYESGRARALLDSLNEYTRELRIPNDPILAAEEKGLQLKIQELVDERSSLVGLTGVENKKTKIDKELTDLKARYETLQARINRSSNFDLQQPLSYDDIRRQLVDDDTSILSYSLGDTKSFAWLLTKEGLETYELPDSKTIENAAKPLVELLKSSATNKQGELETAINEVSRLVVERVSTNLRTPRLIIIADGILQYIPFQILKLNRDANEPLIARFEIVTEPSASSLAIAKRERDNRQPGNKLLIGFGDAVFSSAYTPQGSKADNQDSAKTESREVISKLAELPRLFNAKRELRSIEELVSNDSAFYVEYNATRDNLLNANLGDYRILHVATHGVLNPVQPELSGLVFSLIDAKQQPLHGFLSLAEIYKLRAPVDLVVLSACHTALGKEVRGEGVVGLSRGFMYAGASGVVASLWRVDDRATAELMKHFYTNMLQHGMRPPAALRAAQNTIRSQKQWSSPYYWAGFTFQGDYDLDIKATRPAFTRIYVIAAGVVILVLLFVVLWYLRVPRAR